MLSYIIPIVVVAVLFIIYGILNVDDGSDDDKGEGCDACGAKESCSGSKHDDHAHFEIHKPDMNPAEGLFDRKKDRKD